MLYCTVGLLRGKINIRKLFQNILNYCRCVHQSNYKVFCIPEDGCQEDADVPDVNRYVKQMEQPVDGPWGYHEAGVHGAPDDAAQRVPGALVEPVQEVVEPMLDHVGRGPVVEPGTNTLTENMAAFYILSYILFNYYLLLKTLENVINVCKILILKSII